MPPNAAAVYARLSRKEDGKVRTCAEQVRECKAEAQRRKLSVQTEHVFIDDGISAYSGADRPGFAALMDAVDSTEIEAVLAVEFSRFSRDDVEQAVFLRDCRDAGVAVVADGRSYEPDDEAATLLAKIEAHGAWSESRRKSKRVRAAKAIAVERGLYLGGPRSFGYVNHSKAHPRIPKGELIIEPTEAKAISDAAAWILDGRGLRYVAEEWNRRSVTRPRGGRWDFASVRRVLTDDRIAALQGGRIAAWPPILAPDVFYNVVAVLKGRSSRGGGLRENGGALLSGMLVCDECRSKVGRKRDAARRNGDRPWLYVCRGCERNAAAAHHVDRIVTEEFLAVASDPKLVASVLDAIGGEEGTEVSALLAEKTGIADRLGVLAAEFALGGSGTVAAFRSARRTADARIAKINRALDRRSRAAVVAVPPDDIVARWGDADVEQQRSWLASLTDRVVLHRATEYGKPGCFDVRRVEVFWRI